MLYTVHLKSLSDKCVVFLMYVYVRGTNMYTMWYERASRYEKMLVRKTWLPVEVKEKNMLSSDV